MRVKRHADRALTHLRVDAQLRILGRRYGEPHAPAKMLLIKAHPTHHDTACFNASFCTVALFSSALLKCLLHIVMLLYGLSQPISWSSIDMTTQASSTVCIAAAPYAQLLANMLIQREVSPVIRSIIETKSVAFLAMIGVRGLLGVSCLNHSLDSAVQNLSKTGSCTSVNAVDAACSRAYAYVCVCASVCMCACACMHADM
eukprot:1933897-Amphidinium_carterae.1